MELTSFVKMQMILVLSFLALYNVHYQVLNLEVMTIFRNLLHPHLTFVVSWLAHILALQSEHALPSPVLAAMVAWRASLYKFSSWLIWKLNETDWRVWWIFWSLSQYRLIITAKISIYKTMYNTRSQQLWKRDHNYHQTHPHFSYILVLPAWIPMRSTIMRQNSHSEFGNTWERSSM